MVEVRLWRRIEIPDDMSPDIVDEMRENRRRRGEKDQRSHRREREDIPVTPSHSAEFIPSDQLTHDRLDMLVFYRQSAGAAESTA